MDAILQIGQPPKRPEFGSTRGLSVGQWADRHRTALTKWYHELFQRSADDVEWAIFTDVQFQEQVLLDQVSNEYAQPDTAAWDECRRANLKRVDELLRNDPRWINRP